MAVALIAGVVVARGRGVVWIAAGRAAGWPARTYDAMVHAIFVGFAFSMVFAHAQVIVPAVLGVALPYRRMLYGPLVLLHAGLVVRLLATGTGGVDALAWGGVIDEIAIVVFLGVAVAASRRGRRSRVAMRGAHRATPLAPARRGVAGR